MDGLLYLHTAVMIHHVLIKQDFLQPNQHWSQSHYIEVAQGGVSSRENMKKPPSKVTQNQAIFFAVLPTSQITVSVPLKCLPAPPLYLIEAYAHCLGRTYYA